MRFIDAGESLLPSDEELAQLVIDGTNLELVSRLDDPSFAARQEAMAALVASTTANAQLYAILAREPLSAEQRHRLLVIVRDRLVNRPRGALGISMAWMQAGEGQPGEVRISALLPGLPAEEVLELGDRIARVDGRELRSNLDLVNYVQRKSPGDRVTLSVRRPQRDERGNIVNGPDGQPRLDTMEIELALGSSDLLRDPVRPNLRRDPSEVERDLAREARQVEARWGVEPQRIAVRGSLGPPETRPMEIPLEQVEEHRAVRELLLDLQRLVTAESKPSPQMRAWWEQELAMLRAQANDPSLTAGEQAYLRRVVERYGELLELAPE
jgi:hypothetical protein